MTTTARKLTSITTALAIAVTAMAPLATTASAEGWRDGRRGGGQHYSHNDKGNWGHKGKRRHYAHRRHRRDNTGKYVALGVGALMLGVILSEASRH